jgi:hypothetical protein
MWSMYWCRECRCPVAGSVYIVKAIVRIRGYVTAFDVYPLAGFLESLSSVSQRVMSKGAHV